MSTNLRLSDRAARALREASKRTGRSQQELLREATDVYLGLTEHGQSLTRAVANGAVKPPTAFVDVVPSVRLANGQTTVDLLDRDDEE